MPQIPYDREYFNAILQNYDGSIIVADNRGAILCCSYGLCKLTDLPYSELIGTTLYELCDRGVFSNSVVVECIETQKRVQTFLYAYNDPNRGIYAYAVPIFNNKGELWRVVAFSQDENTSKIYFSRMENIYKQHMASSLNSAMNRQNHTFITKSPASKLAFELAEQIARLDTNIIIYGESGTGKEVLAKFIHENSSRHDQIFVPVNCASIPEALIESELFGYEKGSFTGADKNGKIGLLELAHNGTLFLDEIGEMPLCLQPKLLRFLESGEIRRLGGKEVKRLNIRIIAATNRNLLDMVNHGTFRSDLYYRLNIFPLTLPPLRNRTEDIEPLIHLFLDNYNRKYMKAAVITEEFLNFAMNYNWPGNIRELKNIVHRYVITNCKLKLNDMPEIAYSPCKKKALRTAAAANNESNEAMLTHKEFIRQCELDYFKKILAQTNGNITKVSAITGLHISGIYKKLEKLEIEYRDYKKTAEKSSL